MEATKAATRDYPAFSLNPWGLWDVIYARRSNRKFLPLEPDATFIDSLEETVRLALSTRGAGENSITVVRDHERVERIRRRSVKGLQGKINLWLLRTPVSGFLVLAVPARDLKGDWPRLLPNTAMAAEDCVLWLTEAGLGTCWLGGFNQSEVRRIMRYGEDVAVPAIIPFGKPKPRIKARDMDNLLYRRVSRHRKPLSGIAYLGDMDHPYAIRDMADVSFSASSIQDINGLLRLLAGETGGDGDVPTDLALEACLEAARVAPNSSNAQKWHFILVTAEESVRHLAQACGIHRPWRAAIVGVGKPGRMDNLAEKPFWMLDLPVAFSHISLLAASMDLAVDLFTGEFDAKAVNAMIKLQPPLRTAGVVGLRR